MNPSYLAACSLRLSFKILNGPKWNTKLEFYTLYETKSLLKGIQKIAKILIKSGDYPFKSVFIKYSHNCFDNISILPELSDKYIKELANKKI